MLQLIESIRFRHDAPSDEMMLILDKKAATPSSDRTVKCKTFIVPKSLVKSYEILVTCDGFGMLKLRS